MFRHILLILILFVPILFAGVAAANDWQLLHSEQPGTGVTVSKTQDVTILDVLLPENGIADFGIPVGNPLVIEDLKIAVDVKCSRPCVAVGVQVALVKQNVTFLVPGRKYTGSKNWETLDIPNLAQETQHIASLLQGELKTKFDLSGAYVRQLVLYVENNEQGVTAPFNIELRRPQITGYAQSDAPVSQLFNPLNYAGFKVRVTNKPVYLMPTINENTEWISPLENAAAKPLVASGVNINEQSSTLNIQLTAARNEIPILETPAQSTTSLTRIRLNDSVLSIDDVPVGVRAVEYRGEPLEFLRKLEFNAVWLKEPPNDAIRLEAQKAGIWLICPPPSNAELEPAKTFENRPQTHRTQTLDSSYDNVLAWNLGDECSSARYQSDAQRAQVLQNADRTKRRPLLCTARSGMYDYSRTCEILMMPKVPLWSSLDMLDLYKWQRLYPSLARPDTSFWATVQTQPSAKLAEQWTLYEGSPSYLCALSYEQIKIQIYSALAAGCRGVLYLSETPLTNNDPETEFRRAAVELANWELQLVEEWFAAGRPLNIAQSNVKSMCSAVIQSGRSRLLVPMFQERNAQNAAGPSVAGNVRYVISGIPETYNAYHLVPGRLMPMEAKRVAGGMQIELEEANLNSLIFFGEDDAVYAQVGQRAKLMGARAAYLACHLAELQLAATEQVFTALKRAKDTNSIPVRPEDSLPLLSLPEQESMLKTTKESLDFAKTLVSRNPPDYARGYLQAERSTRGLRFTARDLWQEAMRHEANPCMTPVSVSFAVLPMYLSMYQRSVGAKLGNSRLVGGDFEGRTTLEQFGWEATAHRVEGAMVARRDILPEAKHGGQTGLQLVVVPSDKSNVPAMLETVPLWVTTPPITVRSGEMLCTTGWIRIPQKLQSTADGLMIFDSFGGESMALRFLETNGNWKQFVFYRIAPADGNYYVLFALNGFGEVHLDDIQTAAVQFLPQNTSAPSAQSVPPAQSPSLMQRLNPFQYLPPVPGMGNR
ncbi:hypothetical protein FACS189419_05110 [Planctomycetales bacterium]|nr:hypothetical protein FACS189419_05110 [Planctomycetales bacterium]